MQRNMLKNSLITLIFPLTILNCQKVNKDQFEAVTFSSKSSIDSFFFEYNDSSAVLSVGHLGVTAELGVFENTFNLMPKINTIKEDSFIYVVVANHFYDLGYGFDELSLFVLNPNSMYLRKLLFIEDVGVHKMFNAQPESFVYYDYSIVDDKKLVVREYDPSKTTDGDSINFRTTTKYYSWSK